jgi:hypothetical protein
VLVYDPETNSFVLERVASMLRLVSTRTSRSNTLSGYNNLPQPERHIDHSRQRSKSSDDIPTISLDPPTSSNAMDDINGSDSLGVPSILTPRLPPVTRTFNKSAEVEIESSDDESDINVDVTRARSPQVLNKADPDEDVSDEDLDDLANELESSLENRPNSSSSESESDIPGQPKPPDFGNIPRSGGPISMSRFARGRERQDEESSSESEDDDDE